MPSLGGPYGPLSDGTSQRAPDGLSSMRVTVAPIGGGRLDLEVDSRGIERELVFDPRPIALHSRVCAGGLGAHKWADRSWLDEAQAGLPAGALPLIVDADGAVLEASRANVFAVRDGALFTPPLDGRILPGVTRARVLEIAATDGLETHETELSRDDLLAADEVFLTGSIRGIEPVRALDGVRVGQGGEVAARLTAELRRAWLGAPVG